MIFECSTCGFEKEVENPEPKKPQDESRLFFGTGFFLVFVDP
jgi:hypothetical protein